MQPQGAPASRGCRAARRAGSAPRTGGRPRRTVDAGRAIATALVVLLLLGCTDRVGQDEVLEVGLEYQEDLTVTLDSYAEGLAAVEAEARDVLVRDPEGLPQLFSGVHEATASTVDALEALRPPARLSEAHQELVSVMAAQVETLRSVVAAAGSGDEARLQEHLEEYADGLVGWHRAHDLLAEQLARDDR